MKMNAIFGKNIETLRGQTKSIDTLHMDKNPSGAETRIFWQKFNTFAAYDLAHYITRSSTAMILNTPMNDKQVNVFTK